MASRETPRHARSVDALDALGSMSLRQHTMKSLLHGVADSAKSLMPGIPEVSIFTQSSQRRFTVVSTGQLALDLDEVQYSEHHGPCLHAAITGELTEIRDTRTETRWPDYAQGAAAHGNLSSLSVPLVIDEDVSGALNIYARPSDAFDDDARSAAIRFGLRGRGHREHARLPRRTHHGPPSADRFGVPGRSSTRPRAF